MLLIFACTLFLSASLLFLIQPMMGKQLLPLVGGTPAVWNTCLVFFQALLLLGYYYAHRVQKQIVVHMSVMTLGLGFLWVGVPLQPNEAYIPTDSSWPIFRVLIVLGAAVGIPFFVLASTAPLVQSWFSRTSHHAAANPYVLYVASNAGSMLGLFGYPLLIEPNFTLSEQRFHWCLGFGVCVGLIALCGLITRLQRQSGVSTDIPAAAAFTFSPGRRLRWLALAALPSALLMTSTTSLTTDVAPVPLLWVVPLGLYLLSFIIVFAWWPDSIRKLTGRLTPMALCFLVVVLQTRATEPIVLVGLVHLLALFMVSLLCHGELAADRPHAAYLTQFYLHLSFGGVLGGLFVSLLAPVLFNNLGNLEYPLLVALAGLVRPRFSGTPALGFRRSDLLYPIALAVLTIVLMATVPAILGEPPQGDPASRLLDRVIRAGLTAGVPAAIAFALVWRPVRFALCLSAILLAGVVTELGHQDHLLTCRNYFGTLRVSRASISTPEGKQSFIRLTHGTTLHGQQRIDSDSPPTPAMYYHPRGPLGKFFSTGPTDRIRRVGVVGLGCGAMAAYAKKGQDWTFFEIDPNVIAIAKNEQYFSFLSSAAVHPRIVLGDARRQLLHEPDHSYDLLVLDAFSSDAVPVHLLTREAFEVYHSKLAPHGLLVMHVSNRYLDLAPLAARVAAEAMPGCVVRWDNDTGVSDRENAEGKFQSIWVAIAASSSDFGKLSMSWQPLIPRPGPVWSDDFSHLLGVWKQGDE